MDLTGAAWRKSSFSGGNGGACVEVAIVPGAAMKGDSEEGMGRRVGGGGVVALRDSKNPTGPVLVFTADEWRTFTAAFR